MRYNKDWGKSGKPSEKRKSEQPAVDPLKRGLFKLTPAFVKFVETKVSIKKHLALSLIPCTVMAFVSFLQSVTST